MKQLAENLYTFAIPLAGSPLKSINCHILTGGARNLMVDTAFNSADSERVVLEAMEVLGITPENTDIFLTHMHVDHVGLIGRLKRPQNTVYASPRDKALIDGFQRPEHWNWILDSSRHAGVPREQALSPRQHVAFDNRPAGPVEIQPVEPDCLLTVGEHRLRILDVAGHTPGHLALFDEARGFLFSGDHILGDISPNITAWDLDQDYIQIFWDSLRRVGALPVERIFPAHRTPPDDLTTRIDELLHHHEERLEQMLARLRQAKAPCTAWDIAHHIRWGRGQNLEQLGPQQRWFAYSETLAHLQHLLFTGRASCHTDDGGARRYAPA